MPGYRIYVMNRADQVIRADEFEFQDDQQGLAKARQYAADKTVSSHRTANRAWTTGLVP